MARLFHIYTQIFDPINDPDGKHAINLMSHDLYHENDFDVICHWIRDFNIKGLRVYFGGDKISNPQIRRFINEVINKNEAARESSNSGTFDDDWYSDKIWGQTE